MAPAVETGAANNFSAAAQQGNPPRQCAGWAEVVIGLRALCMAQPMLVRFARLDDVRASLRLRRLPPMVLDHVAE
jgi:hypothetical protein